MIVKICGVTSKEDAKQALDAGADWIGLNLVAGPRRIHAGQAIEIIQALPDPSSAVVLWNVAEEAWLADGGLRSLLDAGVRRVQLYGAVSPDVFVEAAGSGLETIMVWHVAGKTSLSEWETFLGRCGQARPDYVLFDARVEGQLGGTGLTADWDALETCRRDGSWNHWPRVILAGGLTPDNVGPAAARTNPFGVDVSSGVESEPGRKDYRKVEAFIRAARTANS